MEKTTFTTETQRTEKNQAKSGRGFTRIDTDKTKSTFATRVESQVPPFRKERERMGHPHHVAAGAKPPTQGRFAPLNGAPS